MVSIHERLARGPKSLSPSAPKYDTNVIPTKGKDEGAVDGNVPVGIGPSQQMHHCRATWMLIKSGI